MMNPLGTWGALIKAHRLENVNFEVSPEEFQRIERSGVEQLLYRNKEKKWR